MSIDFGSTSDLSRDLTAFFSESTIRTSLLPMIRRTSSVSLRILDWLVTNYAKKHNVVCRTTNGKLFNVHNAYKVALSVYRRQHFDPFRRNRRIVFDIDGDTHETTIGQCHFLYWANVNGVFQYAEEHLSAIEADMNEVAARQRLKKKERRRDGAQRDKRRPLTDGTAFMCHVYNVKQTVTFVL
jgi:hypothetical protein